VTRKSGARVRPIPQRTCVGCREVSSKRQLIRLVRTAQGVRVDPTGKAEGRGAYLHERPSCWEQASRGSLAEALRVELTEADRDLLANWITRLASRADTKSKRGSAAPPAGGLEPRNPEEHSR
jgi:predicted RNA-binding protein YlxR (DUF448 family)